MTNEEYLEYWNCLSTDELIIRCGLYIVRIAELESEVGRIAALEAELDQVTDTLSRYVRKYGALTPD